MFKKIGQVLIFVAICLVAANLQFAFISSLPGAFNQINIGLILLIFILFFFGAKASLLFIFSFGFLMDIFSFQFFGFYFICLATAALVSYLILENWLTNKSLYSFWVLFLVATLAYNLSAVILAFLTVNFQGMPGLFMLSFWRNVFYQSAWNILAAALFFNISVVLAKRFQPFFLEKKGTL
ncbi:MAG TPA: hypothetical protein VFD16_01875 [Candidatus Saccharimonadales bacterium]|nr:hypothetical protein [Candidatus Saccharimonadales bacterium]